MRARCRRSTRDSAHRRRRSARKRRGPCRRSAHDGVRENCAHAAGTARVTARAVTARARRRRARERSVLHQAQRGQLRARATTARAREARIQGAARAMWRARPTAGVR
eukprot:4064255-Pleurochrysis_carterae.AAC.1